MPKREWRLVPVTTAIGPAMREQGSRREQLVNSVSENVAEDPSYATHARALTFSRPSRRSSRSYAHGIGFATDRNNRFALSFRATRPTE